MQIRKRKTRKVMRRVMSEKKIARKTREKTTRETHQPAGVRAPGQLGVNGAAEGEAASQGGADGVGIEMISREGLCTFSIHVLIP
jgi:hypothetical protein